MAKTSSVFSNPSIDTKNCSLNLNEQSKNILFSTLIQQQQIQLNQQHLIQQQLFRQQLHQQSNPAKSFIDQLNQTNQINQFINCQTVCSDSMEVQLSSANLKPIIIDSPAQSPIQSSSLNASSSSMDLPINLQPINQQYSPITASSCDNSLINSPVATPMSQGSPMHCSSPVSSYSQSPNCSQLPVNPQINNQLPSNQVTINQSINQLINFNQQQQQFKSLPKVNIVNKINQNVILVDGQLPKKCRKRKPTIKNQPSLKRVNNSQVKQISPPSYILAGLNKIKLNFDESSCSSNSVNSENGDLKDKPDQSNQPTKIIDKINQKKKARAAANERERKRMDGINKGFQILKEKCTSNDQKLSKMEILRLAQSVILKYRAALENNIMIE